MWPGPASRTPKDQFERAGTGATSAPCGKGREREKGHLGRAQDGTPQACRRSRCRRAHLDALHALPDDVEARLERRDVGGQARQHGAGARRQAGHRQRVQRVQACAIRWAHAPRRAGGCALGAVRCAAATGLQLPCLALTGHEAVQLLRELGLALGHQVGAALQLDDVRRERALQLCAGSCARARARTVAGSSDGAPTALWRSPRQSPSAHQCAASRPAGCCPSWWPSRGS